MERAACSTPWPGKRPPAAKRTADAWSRLADVESTLMALRRLVEKTIRQENHSRPFFHKAMGPEMAVSLYRKSSPPHHHPHRTRDDQKPRLRAVIKDASRPTAQSARDPRAKRPLPETPAARCLIRRRRGFDSGFPISPSSLSAGRMPSKQGLRSRDHSNTPCEPPSSPNGPAAVLPRIR